MNLLAKWAFALMLSIAPGAAFAAGHADANGLVHVKSAHDAATTIDRLAAAVEGAGAKVFARVDHAGGAAKIGEALRPTVMLMFGNPKLGTPLLQETQKMGLDLPLRAVAWTDDDGATFLTYRDPAVMAAAQGIAADHPTVAKMTGALGKLTAKATSN